MRDISKADWKLFQERISGWQEAYMEKLNHEYVKLLTEECPASKKFWALDERIRRDKKTPGVQLQLIKSEVAWDLMALIRDGVISTEDLNGFSEELKEYVIRCTEHRFGDDE
ncbi:MAG: multidrug transporter [Parasporobacterium sp.]|nr:multidrug transporter [Parasporobacterium sp.]